MQGLLVVVTACSCSIKSAKLRMRSCLNDVPLILSWMLLFKRSGTLSFASWWWDVDMIDVVGQQHG